MGGLFSRKFNPETDLLDLQGKVVIVTGGNRGIGYATVLHLARKGAKVYLAARDESKATGAIASLEAEGLGNGQVLWLKLDLSDPREAKKSAEEFLKREQRLDILINNAALTIVPFEKGSDGISAIVVVNHISPFVFTRALLPLLTQTSQESGSDVRIVNLTSQLHTITPSAVSFKEIEDFNVSYESSLLPSFARYAHSKFMNILWTRTLQKRIDSAEVPTPITAISLHPGGVDTYTERWWFPQLSKWLMSSILTDPKHGAYNSAFAAAGKLVAEDREKFKGAYLDSTTGSLASPSSTINDEMAEQLWSTTERFLESIGL